jgi:hypothetical protein
MFTLNEQLAFAAQVHRHAKQETQKVKVRVQDTHVGLRIA